MTEERWGIHGGIAACDLCHARKVKCDRKEPCRNCVATNVQCIRERHKKARRPRPRTDDKIQALVQRLSELEDSVSASKSSPSIHHANTPGVHTVGSVASTGEPPKRKRSESVTSLDRSGQTPSSNASTSTHQAQEARLFIQKELSHNGLLSGNQRTILETAISFVDQITQGPATYADDLNLRACRASVSTDITETEVLHVILGAQSHVLPEPAFQINMLDHINPDTTERIALALLDGIEDEETMLLHKVIVHFKAAVLLFDSQLYGTTSQKVKKRLRDREIHHMHASLKALDGVSPMVQPSLLLLQALICGATLLKTVGDPLTCWTLISAASRTAVALGYHNIRDVNPKTEHERDILIAMAWCCHLDKVMSFLFVRPASLPKMHVTPVQMVQGHHSNPMTYNFNAILQLVPMQERVLELSLGASSVLDPRAYKEEVAKLKDDMRICWVDLQQRKALVEPSMDLPVTLEWASNEFEYWCTMTAVYRLSPTVTTHPEREECVNCARTALALALDIERVGSQVDSETEDFNPHLNWTILSYPLCPFFVLFCNVVGTSNREDFQLLENVTNVIATIPQTNKYAGRMKRLCTTLLGLCRPLVEATYFGEMPPLLVPQTSHPFQQAHTPIPQAFNAEAGPQPTHGGMAMDEAFGASYSPWADDLMWQLFQSQPSLDWFSADILNPTLDGM
ncbi:putative Zn(II)2Cys6 transcription factor-like protein [Polyplosphaeria fusca]|uniref:Zn(II)2Cys6 transcription factor-like protein n=1 Tax=Polyplosphaeria fusca TaxID=682080 RepID=A0A9P4V7U7_9PLEO|nr:putative Zn(II)2Cys6 transcription factor-like protein [Polyplosphaeria fusca]